MSAVMHPYFMRERETSMEEWYYRNSQERNGFQGLNEPGFIKASPNQDSRIELVDGTSIYQPAKKVNWSGGLSPLDQPQLQVVFSAAAEEATSSMLITDESSRGIPNEMGHLFIPRYSRDCGILDKSLCGTSTYRLKEDEIREVHRPRNLQQMDHPPGDEDFEFLRNLLQQAVASPVVAPTPKTPSVSTFPAPPAMVPPPRMRVPKHSPRFLPHPDVATIAKLELREPTAKSDGSTISGMAPRMPGVGSAINTAVLYEVVAEEQLRAADEVAACIWLAGDMIRESLFAHVAEMWLTMKTEIPIIAATGRSFSEEVAERLEETRLAVETELRVADEVLVARCEMDIVEPDWHGSSILRGDVLTRLEAFQNDNRRETLARNPRFSLTECRQDLLERLRGTREAVVAKINANHKAAATAAGGHGVYFSPAISDDEVSMGIDDVVYNVVQQLKAIYIAAEEVRQPTGRVPTSDIRERLLERQRAADEAHLKGINHKPSESDSSAGDTSIGSSFVITRNERSSPARANSITKKKRRPGSGGRRCKNEDCSLHPHFGFNRPEYCSRHKLKGMFNVKGRRCINPECVRTPVYGKKGDPHPTYCAAHKLANMIDIKNPTCREPSCSRQPSFGSPQDRRATYCASHMLEGMLNVRRMRASKSSPRGSTRERSPAEDANARAATPSASSYGEFGTDVCGRHGER